MAEIWSTDQAILPEIRIAGKEVDIRNIRNFSYRTKHDYEPGYRNQTFDLRKLKRTHLVLESISSLKGFAHVFFSFEFSNNQFVAISIEIRKRKKERYSPYLGLLRHFRLMYVIADEKDVIKLRTNHRRDKVYVYPLNLDVPSSQKLFIDMLTRAKKLNHEPEFYNTFFNACATNLVRHLNQVLINPLPSSLKAVFPSRFDKFLYEHGLIDTGLSYKSARKKFFVNGRAEKNADSADFSVKIRAAG